jgi:hypothetical protein
VNDNQKYKVTIELSVDDYDPTDIKWFVEITDLEGEQVDAWFAEDELKAMRWSKKRLKELIKGENK